MLLDIRIGNVFSDVFRLGIAGLVFENSLRIEAMLSTELGSAFSFSLKLSLGASDSLGSSLYFELRKLSKLLSNALRLNIVSLKQIKVRKASQKHNYRMFEATQPPYS